MKFQRNFVAIVLALIIPVVCFGQKDKSTGSIRGRVRDEGGAGLASVTITVRQGEREISSAESNHKGEFTFEGLAPGSYSLTFRKPGHAVATLDNIEVKAGKVRTLSDRLFLQKDAGSIAFLRGSVFTASGLSVPGARVELVRLEEGGVTKRVTERVTDESGDFVFRLPPHAASYRVTVRANNSPPVDGPVVHVEGAAIYRVAVSLPPKEK